MSQTSSSRDFSLFSLFTAGLACMIPLASAYTQPTGDAPEGNPISQPGLNTVVPVGETFSVTWQPTTKGTVTLVLLKGPSTDAEPQYAIAEKVPNSGVYTWTPSDDLEPSEGATGYGLQLIDDKTGAYQYTTQFGISNPDYDASSVSSSSSSSSAVATSTGWTGGYSGHDGPWTETWATASTPTSSSKHSHNATTTTAPYVTGPVSGVPASGVPHNITMVAPTGVMTVPTSLKTSVTVTSASVVSATPATGPTSTSNAAAAMGTSFAGLVFAGAVAVLAL